MKNLCLLVIDFLSGISWVKIQAGLYLMPDRQNEYRIFVLLVTIDGHITRFTSRNHEFTQVIVDRATYERMPL